MSKVKQGQTFIDKIIHQTGSWEEAIETAIVNNLSITELPKIGNEIKTRVINKSVVNFFKSVDEPATKINDLSIQKIKNKGIGNMIVEQTFIIR